MTGIPGAGAPNLNQTSMVLPQDEPAKQKKQQQAKGLPAAANAGLQKTDASRKATWKLKKSLSKRTVVDIGCPLRVALLAWRCNHTLQSRQLVDLAVLRKGRHRRCHLTAGPQPALAGHVAIGGSPTACLGSWCRTFMYISMCICILYIYMQSYVWGQKQLPKSF